MAGQRPRLLVLAGRHTGQADDLEGLSQIYEVDVVQRMDQALEALRRTEYHTVLADVGDFLPIEREIVGDKASMVLNTIGEGVIIVDADGRCAWSNKRMKAFPSEVFEQVKQACLRARAIFNAATPAIAGEPTQARSRKFTCQFNDRYFELMASPVVNEAGEVCQIVGVVWDATSGRRLQQKIDAIDAAGRELTRIESELIAKLSPGRRLKLLQDKVIKYSKDLMHFDHFAIRLLDKRTNKLEVVIAEGLPSDALEIDLYAQPEGNGISGYVSATGRSYICHDTEKDPRYVQGLEHCKSSLTVPLTLFDKSIGVYNIESESVGSFNEDDRQFAEIFARYVAMALNILDLLVVERYTTTGQLADNVVQEMAQPLNDVITEAQSLMEEYIGDDNMRHRLNRIVDNVQSIRKTVRDVAAGPNTVLGSEKAKQSEGSKLLAGKRILISDDEVNIRQTISDVLQKHGAECDVCKDGYEAINTLEQHPFDLVLSDIKMPYRNGYEIFAAARRLSDTMPVILMTGFGYDPSHSIVRASQEGLCGVLFKPFKVDQLIEEICSALEIEPPKPPEDKNAGTDGQNESVKGEGGSSGASRPDDAAQSPA